MFKAQFPNILTLTNLFFGFLSILNCYIDNYNIACYFILLAAFLDSLDGKIARILGVSTEFGKELDSLSDLVSFCLAPSFLVYVLYSQNMPGISGEIIASAPLILGVIRLARFNISENENSSYFEGLPTTFNAIFLCCLILYIEDIKLIHSEYSQPRFLLPIIITSSFLMVSKIKYPKFPALNFSSGYVNTTRYVSFLIFILVFVVSIFIEKQLLVLMITSSGLLLFGLIKYFLFEEKIHIKFFRNVSK
tara:strand:- start:645 stop:1391 length:747 start_codon:yes stop_codon:yes gene_type:complete